MDIKKRKKYFNNCDPYKTASLYSKEVIDIDSFKIDNKEVKVRGKKWAESIAKKIYWSDEPQSIYFTGYPGSGKTTELKRVEAILSDKDYANLLPVYINGLEYLPTHESLDEIDVFATIVYCTIETVSKYQNKSSLFTEGGYFDRFWTWMNETEVTLKNIEIGKDSSKVLLEMKENPSFRTKIKNVISEHPSRFKQEIEKELHRLNELVKTVEINGEKKNGIVVIFDSLEHNRGIGVEAQTVADSIHRLFANRENLLLPLDVIYTLPPHLYTRQVKDIEFLPVVRVINKDNSPCSQGIEVMKALVFERISKDDLESILGKEERMLEEIIKYSGGYPRDLLKLLQECIMVENYPITNDDLESIFQELENEYRDNIPPEYRSILVEIYENKELNFSSSDHMDVAQKLFAIHVILRYRNGDRWFSLNPPSLRALGIKDEDR
jgi:hypothetical protein